MKTAKDPRHLARIQVMQELFAWGFNQDREPLSAHAKAILENVEGIDQRIAGAAKAWPINKINKIDLAILRLAIFELIIEKKVPEKVVVDEAVELAKVYGSESSASFVNGVLGTLIPK